jgi:AcrR family transcriptional regulator
MGAPADKAVRRRARLAPRDPERTRSTILAAATAEFSRKGLDGARIDAIARRSGANKRMIYHYFGGKEGLYLAVLEKSYTAIRTAESELKLADQDPIEGMRTLVRFTWKYLTAHPEFLSLLATENLHRATNLKKLPRIRELHSPLIAMISELLQRGATRKLFRKGVDPMQLYISIAALGFFYLSNKYTLSTIFGRDLNEPAALNKRESHIADLVLGFLRACDANAGTRRG